MIESNPWVISKSIYNDPEASYLDKLRSYTTEGDSYEKLTSSDIYSNPTSAVTILLPIYSKESLSKLDIVKAWKSDITFQISIVCSSQYKAQIDEKIININHIQVMIVDRATLPSTSVSSNTFSPGTAGASVWLQHIHPNDIKTDYVYVIDEKIAASPYSLKELEYTVRVHGMDNYKNALIGTRALVLSPDAEQSNFCLPVDTALPIDKAQPADMILGAWLLHKSWLPSIMTDMSLDALHLPLGYYLSVNLNQQLDIPTIFIPVPEEDQITNSNKLVCEKINEEWNSNLYWKSLVDKNRFPSVLKYRNMNEQGVLMVAQGSKQLISLYPLLCRFKTYPVHLAIIGDDISRESVHHALKETNCDGNVQIHDFTAMKEHREDTSIGRLAKVIKPRILIQTKPSNLTPMYYAIQLVAKAYGMTEIALPEKDIVHALWIPDLSLDALQRKCSSNYFHADKYL